MRMNMEKKAENRTAEVKARLAPSIKRQAEEYLDRYGIKPSQGIAMFYKAIIDAHGLPFELRPNKVTLAAMQEIEEGKGKRYKTYEEALRDIDSEE